MLGKLIKYDFKWINKVMYIYFVVLFITTISVKVVESFEQTLLIVIVDKIVSGMFIGCVISVIITCMMRIWARFTQNIYKDESYLTHTLPVTKNELFNSKIIASMLSLLLSVFVIFICIAFIYLNSSTIETIKVMWQSLVDVYGGFAAVCFIIGMVALVLLEMFFIIFAGIFGIVLGYSSNNYKMIKSIVIGLVSYNVLAVILFIILMIMSNFVDFEIVGNGFPSLSTLKIMGITGIVCYLIYDLALYLAAKKLLNRGVNID